MAKAKQCDRCGGFYIETEPTAVKQLVRNITDALEIVVGANDKEQTRQIIERVVDLCPECSTSLKKWLKGKEIDNG